MIDGDEFAVLLSEVAREVKRRRASEACCGELTLEQFETLRIVARSARSTIGTLSAALGVDLSTMSRNVSVLERNKFLQRVRTAEDGRTVQARLTAKGRNALTTLQCGEKDVLADVYERIPPRERAAVMKALGALRDGLTAGGGRGGDGGNDGDGATDACCAPVPLRRRASAS